MWYSRRFRLVLIAWFVGMIFSGGFFSNAVLAQKSMPTFARKTVELYDKFPEPQPGDWQYEQNEPKQSYAQYLRTKPITLTKQRKYLYLQTIGELTPGQEKVIEKTREYLAIFYGMPTRDLPALEESILPRGARRIAPGTLNQEQFNVMYLIEKVMLPRVPKDAAVYLVFTATDLWPGNDWNFCFGYATYRMRVGAWSIARNGNADNEEEFTSVLRRTLRLATHETGHMFSIPHCTYYRCNMNGSNSLEEADTQPLEFCPQCLSKLSYATKFKFKKRWTALEKFYRENGLEEEADFVQECLDAQE